MKTAALIIASGKDFDPLKKIGGLSALRRLIAVFRLAGADTVAVAVSEAGHKALEKDAARLDVIFLTETGGKKEMFDYAKTGLTYLADLCDQIFVTPVDVPLFSTETLKALSGAGRKLALPVWREQRGHPLLVSREAVPSLLGYSGDRGLAGAVADSDYKLALVAVEDPGVVVKAGEAGENRELLAGHELNRWRPVFKLQIAKEEIFLGPGVRQLLQLINNTGSVQLASRQMGISYSKAWKMLNNLEKQLGYSTVFRKQGGRRGGETSLTKEGEGLLEWFVALEKKCAAAAGEIFQAFLAEQRHSGDRHS